LTTEPPNDGALQTELPFRLHSFVLKIWLEDKQGEEGPLLWRGHIVHVGSAAEKYVKSVEEAIDFIHEQLKD
jgi:hypothetical protein